MKLIYDVGLNNGEDTEYYLKMGYSVVGIDASSELVLTAKNKFREYIHQGKLHLVNFAITNSNGAEVDFYMSRETVWNSLNRSIANRNNLLLGSTKVKTKKLSTLIGEYGSAYYCKIDIEGFDLTCLETLLELKELPVYISVETECVGEAGSVSERDALATLEMLYRLGYRKFKLIDQYTLCVVRLEENNIFRAAADCIFFKNYRYKMKKNFKLGSSGPFGRDLPYKWLDYETSVRLLLQYRRAFFQKQHKNYDFWCDWHAEK